MTQPPALDAIRAHRIVPVLVLPEASAAPALGQALVAGGLPVAEVTLRTAAALEAIALLSAETDALVGAGTVTRAAQVGAAVEAGARFIVSPGLSAEVVAECRRLDVLVVPGVATATEVMQAAALGLRCVKLFPAHIAGGPAALAALGGPFPDMAFMPTGGVNADNLAAYLTLANVIAVGGTWMLPSSALAAGDWLTVEHLVRDAVHAADAVRPRTRTGALS